MYPQDIYYLYTLTDCGGCERARHYLNSQGMAYVEHVINDPVRELGVLQLFKGQLYAPFLWHLEKGLFIFGGDDEVELLRVKIGGH